MPRKLNKRKQAQAERRKAEAAQDARSGIKRYGPSTGWKPTRLNPAILEAMIMRMEQGH